MIQTKTAFAPANISCIFRIHKGISPDTTGSTGIGFTLTEGVHATVSLASKTTVLFNKKRIIIAPVLAVIAKLTTNSISVSLVTSLPLGGGFGVSGAATLATAYALNALLTLKKDRLTLAKLSHEAEVESKTGLGDVTNQYFGGFLLKTKPSFMFSVQRIPLEGVTIYCKFFSTYETKKVLQNESMEAKINMAGEEAIENITKIISQKKTNDTKLLFAKIITFSKTFAKKSGLLKQREVKETIQTIEQHGGYASMIMLGNAVFSNMPFPGSIKYTISSKCF